MLIIGILFASSMVFAQSGSQPEPNYGNLPAQRIGPNDLLSISVYDQPELTRTIRVTSDGIVRLPMVKKPLRAQGLFPFQLEEVIAAELKAEDLVVQPIVTVNVAEYQSHPISVGGAVKNPITFQAVEPVRLLDALNRAGGLTPTAGSDVLVTFPSSAPGASELTKRVPVDDLMSGANPELNFTLTGGEEIRVPEVGKIYVLGEVRHPGAFPVQANNETTLLQALAMAEGIDRQGVIGKQAYIYRRDKDGSKKEIVVDLKDVLDRKAPDVRLVAQDILYVPENKDKKIALSVLEKIALFAGTGGATALAYTALR